MSTPKIVKARAASGLFEIQIHRHFEAPKGLKPPVSASKKTIRPPIQQPSELHFGDPIVAILIRSSLSDHLPQDLLREVHVELLSSAFQHLLRPVSLMCRKDSEALTCRRHGLGSG